MIKTRTWVLIFVGLAALSALAICLLHMTGGKGQVARIEQDGVCVKEIDLSRVTEPYSFVLETTDGGSNTIEVEPGRICVSEADCPDGICVRQGWLAHGAGSIVCLPHGLVIRLAGSSDSGADAVTQ